MKTRTHDLAALQRLHAKVQRIIDLNAAPLMQEWRATLEEDNRRGVMAGTDGWDRPLAPLAESTLKNRKGDGPPLAPMGEASRVIANFVTASGNDGKKWFAIGAWRNVLSKRGVSFLPFHFKGMGWLPVRNLARCREWGRQQARKQMVAWAQKFVAGVLRSK